MLVSGIDICFGRTAHINRALIDQGAFEEFIEYFHHKYEFDVDDILRDFQERLRGEYPTDEDFAREFADDLGVFNDATEHLEQFIDWGKYAEWMMQDFVELEGHYFHLH